jgi:hypothetical protein
MKLKTEPRFRHGGRWQETQRELLAAREGGCGNAHLLARTSMERHTNTMAVGLIAKKNKLAVLQIKLMGLV